MAKLPISEFIEARLKEYDPGLEIRSGTPFSSLFIKPLQFIVQPLRDEADDIQVGQSLRRILQSDDPDAFDEEKVDDLVSNVFVNRVEGSRTPGVARAYYNEPVAREFPRGGAVFVGNNGKNYANTAPYAITRGQMSAQIENGLYYLDIPVEATEPGEDGDLEAGGLVSLLSDPDVVSVTNVQPFIGGRNRESNTQLIERAAKSIGVRDLLVDKGFNATIFENFPSTVTELQPIGLGDEELMRDILFNTHVGGKVDGYFAGTALRTGQQNFVGVLVDTTRQTASSANIELAGTAWKSLGNSNLDRTGGRAPVVQQVKVATKAEYVSPVDMSSPLDLSANQRIKMTVQGVAREIRLAGISPAATVRNELVALINNAFGLEVAFARGTSLAVRSYVEGKESEIVIEDPDVLVAGSAINAVFGLAEGGGPYIYQGDGPITFLEDVHYQVNDSAGEIRRVVGSNILGSLASPKVTGSSTAGSAFFTDPTLAQFNLVSAGDILTITSGADAKDYRILAKSGSNTLELDAPLTETNAAVEYYIHRTGIKDGELLYVEYWFNPLSIDIGGLVALDADAKTRGIRPGRDAMTITDTAFIRIQKIELIDPLSEEPIGTELNSSGGFGAGPFGGGPFGIGSSAEYYLVVNDPTARFSAWEDSYIVINSGYQGLSFRVTYDYAPEVVPLHNFVRGQSERVLNGDILMKHFLPAFVSGTIRYGVDPTDSSLPTNDELLVMVKAFINSKKAGSELHYSEIVQFIRRKTDPFDRYAGFVEPFTLEARVHLHDGTVTVVSGDKKLAIEKPDPFPKYTPAPLSPRITKWVADEIVLERI